MEKLGSTLVEQVYSHAGIKYVPGRFNHHSHLSGCTSSYSPPKKPVPQKVLQVEPKALMERVLMIIQPGQDGRQKVESTTNFPYSIHAQLEMEFDDGNYGGSGSLVGPHHVLTCAHNIYDKSHKWWANKIVVYPGRNGDSAPFGKATITKAYIFKEWQEVGSKESDIALLLLDRSIGKLTGWGSVHFNRDDSLANEAFHITGYPGDKGCKQMWSMCYRLKQIHAQTFDYEIDTAPGQSGSAIWSDKFGQPTIIGVHTLGSDSMNYGVRITEEFFRSFILGIIKETYKLKNINQLFPIKHLAIKPPVSDINSHGSSSQHMPFPVASTSGALPPLPVAPLPTTSASGSSISQGVRAMSISAYLDPQPQLPEIAFGKAKWAEYFGDIGIEPPLPHNIHEILNSPCIYEPGKRVHETHLLVLIPNAVNGKPFNLDALEELIQNPKAGFKTKYAYYYEGVKQELGTKSQPSHWVLMTRDVIPYSRNKAYDAQQVLVQNHARESGIPYELPTALEAATAILLEYVQKETRLYGDSPWTYTRCQEKVNSNKWLLAIGGFAAGGLHVSHYNYWDGFDHSGVGVLRKFR